MGKRTQVRVTIFDDSREERCSASCGIPESGEEAIQFVTDRLHDMYGNAVQVESFDLAQPLTHRQNAEIVERIRAQNLPLPLVAIDGVPRLSGSIEYRAIADAIEAQREIRGE